MKNLILVFAMMLMLASCTKQASNKLAPIKMTVAELKARYGIDLMGEEVTARANGRGKVKADAVVVVWENDLTISGSVSCTTSPNAEWGGIQKFLAEPLSNDGAVSVCNFYFWVNPGSMNCPTTTPGVYRGWTSDHDYNIHISNTITIQ